MLKEFGGGFAELSRAQHFTPFVEIQMMMGEMSEMYQRAKKRAEHDAKARANEVETLEELSRAMGNF